jgi:hypothetical protein
VERCAWWLHSHSELVCLRAAETGVRELGGDEIKIYVAFESAARGDGFLEVSVRTGGQTELPKPTFQYKARVSRRVDGATCSPRSHPNRHVPPRQRRG